MTVKIVLYLIYEKLKLQKFMNFIKTKNCMFSFNASLKGIKINSLVNYTDMFTKGAWSNNM